MQIASLTFGPSIAAPPCPAAGVAIAAERLPASPLLVRLRGSCRMPKSRLTGGPEALVGALAAVLVFAPTQRPALASLAGEHLVADGDVQDLGADLSARFECVVDLSGAPRGAWFVHATCFEHVSNVVLVPGQP